MLFAIDIGNSSINIGFFIRERLITKKIDTFPVRPFSVYEAMLREVLKENGVDKISGEVIISSVVPELTLVIRAGVIGFSGSEPLMVSSEIKTGLKFAIANPGELGADRISVSVGAVELYGAPVVVMDFGTATTVNFIGEGNIFKGGAILPGLGLMRDVLHERTARLPLVDIEGQPPVLGKDTKGSILSGILYGSAGAVQRLISDVEQEEAERYKVVLTGGFSGVISGFLKRCDAVEPALTLMGMKAIYGKNR